MTVGVATGNNSYLKNQFYQMLSPNPDDEGVWVHQNAWFAMGNLTEGFSGTYEIKTKDNGIYAFVLERSINIEGQELNKRDGFGIWNTDKIKINASINAKVLLMNLSMLA